MVGMASLPPPSRYQCPLLHRRDSSSHELSFPPGGGVREVSLKKKLVRSRVVASSAAQEGSDDDTMDPTFLPRHVRRTLTKANVIAPAPLFAASTEKNKVEVQERPPARVMVRIVSQRLLDALLASSPAPPSSSPSPAHKRKIADAVKSTCEKRVSHCVNYVSWTEKEVRDSHLGLPPPPRKCSIFSCHSAEQLAKVLLRCSTSTKASELVAVLKKDSSAFVRDVEGALQPDRVQEAREGECEVDLLPEGEEGHEQGWSHIPQRVINRAARRALLADKIDASKKGKKKQRRTKQRLKRANG